MKILGFGWVALMAPGTHGWATTTVSWAQMASPVLGTLACDTYLGTLAVGVVPKSNGV